MRVGALQAIFLIFFPWIWKFWISPANPCHLRREPALGWGSAALAGQTGWAWEGQSLGLCSQPGRMGMRGGTSGAVQWTSQFRANHSWYRMLRPEKPTAQECGARMSSSSECASNWAPAAQLVHTGPFVSCVPLSLWGAHYVMLLITWAFSSSTFTTPRFRTGSQNTSWPHSPLHSV